MHPTFYNRVPITRTLQYITTKINSLLLHETATSATSVRTSHWKLKNEFSLVNMPMLAYCSIRFECKMRRNACETLRNSVLFGWDGGQLRSAQLSGRENSIVSINRKELGNFKRENGKRESCDKRQCLNRNNKIKDTPTAMI